MTCKLPAIFLRKVISFCCGMSYQLILCRLSCLIWRVNYTRWCPTASRGPHPRYRARCRPPHPSSQSIVSGSQWPPWSRRATYCSQIRWPCCLPIYNMVFPTVVVLYKWLWVSKIPQSHMTLLGKTAAVKTCYSNILLICQLQTVKNDQCHDNECIYSLNFNWFRAYLGICTVAYLWCTFSISENQIPTMALQHSSLDSLTYMWHHN